MLTRYVVRDLIRNPRRTLSTMVGVTLGVGLFCGVLFFVDGLSASMTQRAVEPLSIDMQRIVTEQVGGSLKLTQAFDVPTPDGTMVQLLLTNDGELPANEVTVRSVPGDDVTFVPRSAELDGVPLLPTEKAAPEENPFAQGQAKTGLNVGTVKPGATHRLSYLVLASAPAGLDDDAIRTTYSSRESVSPVAANELAAVPLERLSEMIAEVEGVTAARQLSFANLGPGALSSDGTAPVGGAAGGRAKIFGFDADYANSDPTITMVEGTLGPDVAVISAEAADALGLAIGDVITVTLSDQSALPIPIGGVADLSQARSLFSSRRGGDLETFIYIPNSVIVSPQLFADKVLPAYERAATTRGQRLKNPPIREVDVSLDRRLLDADPATALVETKRIAVEVGAIAGHQDFVLDNISNTLSVATADAAVAKRLFVFLGVPGGFLAAILAAYAGTVLAEAQRREQATLRIRGAGRRDLTLMLALRTSLLTTVGALLGLVLGYGVAAAILGRESLERASAASLIRSALVGSLGGLVATGLALYITGRRSIDRQIAEDKARLAVRPPLWRRAWLDVIGAGVVIAGTAIALQQNAFDGTPGSVYFGRSVQLNLVLLVLPIAVWITGSLLGARVIGNLLRRGQPTSSGHISRVLPSLYRLSIGRRPWSVANGALVVCLIVALSTSLGAFTTSYDTAKAQDARYANGSDIRVTPSQTSSLTYATTDVWQFETEGVLTATPVIYGVSNVILRSDRTSDPANLAAVQPATFGAVVPVEDDQFVDHDAADALRLLSGHKNGILVNRDMAAFLQTGVGDSLQVLLARATDQQAEIELRIVGLYDRLPGFPEGADAVMDIAVHTATVPSKSPDFFLAATASPDDAGLELALSSLRAGPASTGQLQIDTRLTTLARDQSSLAALNIAGLVDLDSVFALAMAVVTIAIFVFGLLLQRRREYITLRAQGLEPSTIRFLITSEAGTVAVGGAAAGVLVGTAMGYYFVSVLRPLFVLSPGYVVPFQAAAVPVAMVLLASLATSAAGSRLIGQLEPTELLRDE